MHLFIFFFLQIQASGKKGKCILERLPCSETLELVSTITLLTLLHQAIATVTRIHWLHEEEETLSETIRKLPSYIGSCPQKQDTEPQTPVRSREDISSKIWSPLCTGRVLHDCASSRCLSTWTSRTCRWYPHQGSGLRIRIMDQDQGSRIKYLDIKNLPLVSTSFGVQSFLSSGSCFAPKACISS